MRWQAVLGATTGITVLAAIALVVTSVHAWHDMGHVISAEIARRMLQQERPELIDRINQLSQVVAPYFRDRLLELPYSSVWMDKIRNDTGAFDTQHYRAEPITGPDYNCTENIRCVIDATNVATSLQQLSSSLMFSNQSQAWGKGLSMLMLVHFIGDLHQPLHATQFFSQEFPRGDVGGNLYNISYADDVEDRKALQQSYHQLHLLFDACGGVYTGYAEDHDFHANMLRHVDQLLKDFPKEQYLESQLNPAYNSAKEFHDRAVMPWLRESAAISKWVYSQLNPARGVVRQAFLDRIRSILRERVALAGYRLALVLKRVNYTMVVPVKTVNGTWENAEVGMVSSSGSGLVLLGRGGELKAAVLVVLANLIAFVGGAACRGGGRGVVQLAKYE